MKKKIDIIKTGKFYNVYGDDAIIFHFLFGYKYDKIKKSAGFPVSALNKIVGRLEQEKISYVIFEKNNLEMEYKGFDKNYKEILKKSLTQIQIDELIVRLNEKLMGFDLDKLEKLVELLENE